MGEENSLGSHGSPFASFNSRETANSFSTIASRPWALNALKSGGSPGFGSSSQSSMKPKATVKVLLAEVSPTGKPMVNPSNPKQTFVPIHQEEDANVGYLLSTAETNFNEKNLMLVSNSGFQYSDEPGTRGRKH